MMWPYSGRNRDPDPDFGVSPKVLRCQEDQRNGCFQPDAKECPRGGWILTPFDTWVSCGIHGPGEHHPEDDPRVERGPHVVAARPKVGKPRPVDLDEVPF